MKKRMRMILHCNSELLTERAWTYTHTHTLTSLLLFTTATAVFIIIVTMCHYVCSVCYFIFLMVLLYQLKKEKEEMSIDRKSKHLNHFVFVFCSILHLCSLSYVICFICYCHALSFCSKSTVGIADKYFFCEKNHELIKFR